ncbi:TPA: YraN family protein [Candidatus Dependentiae bacterium]|nr:MAG: hypothetical protein US03_C0002G0170 [candidate division TM6 bacterium GW2011_GWF2_36_131]KKQ03603.1 MAG: hypothetical protein US13_C0002G0169 [candidate division TM6 bacterium GW2011_GWE2_36_25]KKQ20120.1 MAG: hypothetical protein US32_C0001G0017 [candidate division TM6 bacterium GW2011_GWA2_36_9]HBR70663.1 YraN family protein [Candidatus Dependentiae bacterium]HCU00283.1 YraN family protein [Candidatus Dependentiae bacterium]
MPELSNRLDIGKKGEELVVQWLKKNGYKIVAQNYRSCRGEIDIIAQKNEICTFIEVKRRKSSYFALSEVITKSKQQKITFTAQKFMSERPIHSYAYRFDVALVEGLEGSETITYIEQAFRDERFSY